MTMKKTLAAAGLAVLLGACGSSGPDYAAGTPNVAGLALETSGGVADGLPATAGALTVGTSEQALGTCQPYQYLCNIHEAVAGINLFVRAAVEPVEALVALPPAAPANRVRVFGPADLAIWGQAAPVATFRLTVLAVTDDLFRWKLEARPVSSSGAFVVVMAGQLLRGDLPHRGRGIIGVDLDAFAAVNPAVFTGQGKLLASFAHAGEAKALFFALQNFKASASAQLVPAAVFAGYRLANGVARVRLASVNEFVPPPSGADLGNELLLSRAGWWPGVGGRAAVAVTGGDVPSYGVTGFTVDFFLAVGCYDASQNDVYRDLFACSIADVDPTTGRHCAPVPLAAGDPRRTGSPTSCVAGTDLYDDAKPPPATGEMDALAEAGTPVIPDAPPAAMPSAAF